jgi:hypothetical protein
MCQDRDEDGQFVKVLAHCPIAIARKLTPVLRTGGDRSH